jgi:hypothetical protein
LDIVSANTGSNTVGILLGNGDGTLAAVMTYFTFGSSPHSVAVGDINNDNNLDLAIVVSSSYVIIFLGLGNGSFIFEYYYSTGANSRPFSIALANFNSDNHLDIAVTNINNNNVDIFFGNGDGTFTQQTTYSTGSYSHPYYVIIADFNNDYISDIAATLNDNISDIVVAKSGTSNIFFPYGYGNGTFGNETLYPLGYGYNPYSVTVKDLNEDGWMDVVIACYSTDHVETLIKMC